MKAIAIALTFGRSTLPQLLGCWARQTRRVSLFVWVDDAPSLRIEAGELVTVFHGKAFDTPEDLRSVANIRNAAISAAREYYGLAPQDVIMVLDDDDFYSPAHAQTTLAPFDDPSCEWVGSLAFGLESSPSEPPVYVCGERGPGQHATWAYRLSAYDRGEGYLAAEVSDDPGFGRRMGWNNCRSHYHCTHVRSHHDANLSAIDRAYDRAAMRARSQLVPGVARPEWTARSENLAFWCAQHFTPRAAQRCGARVPAELRGP